MRFHIEQTRHIAAHLCGRDLYQEMLAWETAEQTMSGSRFRMSNAGYWSPPGCATCYPTSPGWPSIGVTAWCTARTTTAGKCVSPQEPPADTVARIRPAEPGGAFSTTAWSIRIVTTGFGSARRLSWCDQR